MGKHFDHAFTSAIGNGAIIAAKRGFKTNHLIGAKTGFGITKAKSDMRQFRIAIGHPWHR